MWRRSLPVLEPLDGEQLDRLDATVTTLLQEFGIRVMEPRVLQLLRDAGLTIEDDLVRFDRAFVDEQVAKAPREFEVRGRDPLRSIVVGGANLAIAPTGGQPFVLDVDGRRRYPSYEDYVTLTKLTHAAEPLHATCSGIVECGDRLVASRHLDMDRATIRYSDKPYFSVGADTVTTRDCVGLAAIAFGGREAIAAHPVCLGIVNPISPLQYDERMAGSLYEYVDGGQALVLMPYLLAGATAPLGIAGAVAQAAAEALAGAAIAQTIRPGNPTVFGTYVVEIDLHSGLPIFGTPGAALAILAAGQLARRYGLPFRAGGAFTDQPSSSIRATQDSLLSLWPSLLAGANVILHGAGWLDGSLSTGLQKIAEDVEALARLERVFCSPLDLSDEGLSLEAFREVGPGGIFLGAEHTLRLLHAGEHTQAQPGHEASWEVLLDAYEDPGIDPAVEAEMDAFVATRSAELAAG